MGHPEQGCRFCGRVEEKLSADAKVVLYHAGLECCEAALAQQLHWREAEARQLRAKMESAREDYDRLLAEHRAWGQSRSSRAIEARLKAERARQGLEGRLRALRGQLQGLVSEVRRLKERVQAFDGAAGRGA